MRKHHTTITPVMSLGGETGRQGGTGNADREGGIAPQRNKTTRHEKEWQRRRHDSPEKNEEEEKTSSVRRGEEKMSEAQVKRKKKTDTGDQIRSDRVADSRQK